MVIYGTADGDAGETDGGAQRTTAADLCMVFVGTDMRGMSTMDLPAVAGALNEITRSTRCRGPPPGDRQHVGSSPRCARRSRTRCSSMARRATGSSSTRRGSSTTALAGAIFGTAVMAYEPTVTRAYSASRRELLAPARSVE